MSEWIVYNGTGRPVPNGTLIEVKQRDGKIREGTHAALQEGEIQKTSPEEAP